MKKEQIKINGQIYTTDNIEWLQRNAPEWQQEIFSFLENWFDHSDTISTRTSGSTGTPKEILLFKNSMRESARKTNSFFDLNSSKNALLCLPASYIAGKMMLVRAIVGGFNLIAVEPTANPFDTLSFVVNFAAITPHQLHHSTEILKSTAIENIIVGGGHIDSRIESRASEIPAAMYETFGMTETVSHIALRRFNGKSKSDSFTVFNGISIRHDQRGCLVIEAPFLSGEKIITNDIVEIMNEKSFRWLGRIDSIINSGGIKIFPEQVEKKLEGTISCPYFIASLPDEEFDNKVVMVIESEKYDAKEEKELKKKIQNLLTKYEKPKQVLYVPKFIYSSSGKVLRRETLSDYIDLDLEFTIGD